VLDLTKGNERQLIWKFALPILIGSLLQQIYLFTDMIIVGQLLGDVAVAAIGNSFSIIFSLISLIVGIAIAGTVIIAQYYGAKDDINIQKTINTLNLFLLISGVVVTFLGVYFTESLFRLIQLPETIIPQAVSFLRTYFWGILGFFGYNAISSVLRGLGDSKTPLYFLIISSIVNIFLDLLFIGVFEWGIRGAAIATIISQGGAFIAVTLYLNFYNNKYKYQYFHFSFDKVIFIRFLRIGLPSGLQQTFVAFGMMALNGIVNKFGEVYTTAYSAVGRIESMIIIPAMALSMALTTFTGQNIGAGNTYRAKKGLMATLQISLAITIFLSILLNIFSKPLLMLFTHNPEVLKAGGDYIMIVGSFYLSFSVMFTYTGALRGAGDTLIPMFITLFSLWIIRVPLAYFLSNIMGPIGIWWSIPASWSIGLLILFIYYQTGRWKKESVVPLPPLSE